VLREYWEKVSRVDAGSSAGFFVAVVIAMSFVTLVSLFTGGIAIAVLGWVIFLFTALLRATVIERGSRLLTVKGASTPHVPQHSNIQALVARGRYPEAAEAYKAAIATDPADLVACEQLGMLALRELKDYELALFAAREGEKRVPDAARQAGFALQVASIYRDNLKDYGRTMVELRRILARYPGIPNAARLRAEIDELKALHFEAR
jgi:tetratricopeptide (TPR) repeat protein